MILKIKVSLRGAERRGKLLEKNEINKGKEGSAFSYEIATLRSQ
jgi:hypothetical protein